MSADYTQPLDEKTKNDIWLKAISDNLGNGDYSRNSDSNVFGEDYYANPLTNVDYSKDFKDVDINRLLYDLGGLNNPDRPVIRNTRLLNQTYEGYNVITDIYEASSVSLGALKSLDAPILYSDPGYLVSFRIAVNDPEMAMKCWIKGSGDFGYTLADYTMRKMAVLGLGMTIGEAEELIYIENEGQTSRDLSGQPSTEYPYLVRYKHLPTGTETDYNVYKGTDDDAWIIAEYTPKILPKFNTMFFDVFNSNPSGDRLIHHLQIKRLIIMDVKNVIDNPDRTKSVLNINPADLASDLLGQGQGNTDLQNIVQNSVPKEQVIANQTVNPNISVPLPTANYTKRKIMKKSNDDIYFSSKNPPTTMYTVPQNQQNNELFDPVMAANLEIMKELVKNKIGRVKYMKSASKLY